MTSLALRANTYVERDADSVFDQLHDPRTVVSCVPGAILTRMTGPRTFDARIAIGFGPLQSHFDGSGRITASDARRRRASLEVSGSPASVRMAMAIVKRKQGAEIRMRFDVLVSDRAWPLAQFWLDPIAGDLLDRTTRRLKRRLEEAALVTLPPTACAI